MLNLLVEVKNEYTSQLVNVLSPLIFQGIQSIYSDARNIVKDKGESNTTLKIFQSCLKSIINWNSTIIEKETMRIVTSSYNINNVNYNYDWLHDLVKATLKSHITILMFNPKNKSSKINSQFYQNIKLTDFIHKVYIECAIELWNNPYLLYHEYQPIEIKRNQRDCIIIIKDCIKEAIRKLLPINHILKQYLNDDGESEDEDKIISDIKEKHDAKLINNYLSNKKLDKLSDIEKKHISTLINKKLDRISDFNSTSESDPQINSVCNDNNINNKIKKSSDTIILDIIHKQSSLSVTNNNIQSAIEYISDKKKNLDNKIEYILNELNVCDSDDNSLVYSNDNNNNYQEIFSNSNIIKD